MRIVIDEFAGIAPKISPKKLGDALATLAINTRLDRGGVESWKDIAFQVFSPFDPEEKDYTVFYTSVTKTFLVQSGLLSVADSIDLLGKNNRLYVTKKKLVGGKYQAESPFIYDVDSSTNPTTLTPRPLGVPVPPKLKFGAFSSSNAFVRSYRYSYVNDFGEEGALSEPTTTTTTSENSRVTLYFTKHPQGNYYRLGTKAKYRIYRANNGVWQYVNEVAYGTNLYEAEEKAGELQELAITENWLPPPDTDIENFPDGALQGLIALPSGILAGFTGRTVCFSAPYAPHGWPADYRATIPQGKIIGLATMPTGVLVMTDGAPYLIQGSSPDALIPIRLEGNYGCISERSIVDFGDSVIYASKRGLVQVTGNKPVLLSQDYFTEAQWESLVSPAVIAGQFDNKYVAFFQNDELPDAQAGIIFDPTDTRNMFTFIQLPRWVRDVRYSPELDRLMVLSNAYSKAEIEVSGDLLFGVVGFFNRGQKLEFQWQTKEFVVEDRVGINTLRIEAAEYPVKVEVFADGKSRLLKTVNSNKPVKIPSGFLAQRWQIRIGGTNHVDYVVLADSAEEIN